MPILKRNNRQQPSGPGIVGPVRLCKSPRDLSAIRAGDIAVIEEVDLETEQARELVDRGVAAVLNVVNSSTGRFPNLGPQVLLDAEVELVDAAGETLWQTLRSGDVVRVDQGAVYLDDKLVATGIPMTQSGVQVQLSQASSGLSSQLDSIVTNAADTLRRDRAMLLEGAGIPAISTKISNRPVVLVHASDGAAAELKSIRRFIHDNDPVLVAGGAGAELLVKAGLRPHLVVDHADELSERVIDRARELVVVSASGRLETPERFERHGRQPVLFTASGAPENLALLLVDQAEAAVIIQVGGATRLLEIIEANPADAAGTFITRLRAGSRVVDARNVDWFARQRLSWFTPILLLLAGVVALGAAVSTTAVGHEYVEPLLKQTSTWIEGIF